jgi:hypothetical protein
VLSVPSRACANELEDGARALARRVVATLRGGGATFAERNLSSLGSPEFSSVELAFQDELQRGGVKILRSVAGTEVTLTISGNLTDYVAAAQVLREGHKETFIENLGPRTDAPSGEARATFALEKEFLFGQEEAMVDVALSSDAKNAEVLGVEGIFFYERQSEHWVLTHSERLPAPRSATRVLRGIIDPEIDSDAAYLPGEVCTTSVVDKGWSCDAYGEHMPVRGVGLEVVANKKLGSWWSAAQVEVEGITGVVITGEDGVARLYEDGPNAVAEFSGWGSEIASIHNSCGNGWQLLVTSKTDQTKPDTVQAMEIQSRRVREVSPALELLGPVIALHTPTTRSDDKAAEYGSAVAIVRNLQTGRYEAYRITIGCGN